MLDTLTILVPGLAGTAAFVLPDHRTRRWLLIGAAVAHLGLSLWAFMGPHRPLFDGALLLDEAGRLFLLITSVLFLAAACYTAGYLERETRGKRQDMVEGSLFSNSPEARFTGCLLLFLASMSFVCMARNLGLLWVGVEATTLASAPLIYFHRHHRSLEATWKYLLLCSVGIALALFGTYMLALAGGGEVSLSLDALLSVAPTLNPVLLKAAFVFLVVGYGTKMGLAPMHTWKPDVYGEASGVIGAMLAGGVTSCAFLALLRITHICQAAGQGAFTSRLLLFTGLFSMAVAAMFMAAQRDFKRMLAYSSVEHMGILVLGLGLGSAALFGTMLHVVTNGLTKGVMFLSAGNIHRAYDSKSTDQVRGVFRRLPVSGSLFFLGFLAITGSPPFGPFVSEFAILTGSFKSGQFLVGAAFLFLLLVVFAGMSRTVLRAVQGRAPATGGAVRLREGFLTTAPPVVLMVLVLLLGLAIPAPLQDMLTDAVRFMEVRP